MIEHFRTSTRRRNRHPENLLGPLLPNEFRKRARPERKVELAIFFDADSRRHPSLDLGGTFRGIVGGTQRGVEILMWLTFRQAAPPMIYESSVLN
jgi:hypothetical protein